MRFWCVLDDIIPLRRRPLLFQRFLTRVSGVGHTQLLLSHWSRGVKQHFQPAVMKTKRPMTTQNNYDFVTVPRETSCIITEPSVPAGVFLYFLYTLGTLGYGFPLLSSSCERRDRGKGGPPGLRNNLRLHPLCIIEQISCEQLLPVKMTRFGFIATDKRSGSICMLQLSAVLISLLIPAFNISRQT